METSITRSEFGKFIFKVLPTRWEGELMETSALTRRLIASMSESLPTRWEGELMETRVNPNLWA